jgi:hypothetical protein
MREVARGIVLALPAILGAVLVSASVTMTPTALTMTADVRLQATYALKGTQFWPIYVTSDQAIQEMATRYVGGFTGSVPTDVNVVPNDQGVSALQQAIGTDGKPVIFGYSQGAFVGSDYKKAFNADPTPGTIPTFVLVGNSERPNGGFSTRLDDVTTGSRATPTETANAGAGQITTYDITGQYDPDSDYPTNPLNLLSLANATAGFFAVHLNYPNFDPADAVLQDQYGDTKYYLFPTYPVPLLMPVQMIPGVGPVVADMLDPVVRLMVEAGYDRTISPGEPTPSNYLYSPDPNAMASNLSIAMATGMDNASEDMGMGRPQGTTRPDIGPGSTGQGAYGIGGPPVTMDPAPTDEAEEAAVSLQQDRPQWGQQQQQPNVSDESQLDRAVQPPADGAAVTSGSGAPGDGGVQAVEREPGSVASRTFASGGHRGQGGNAGRFGSFGPNGAKGFRESDGTRAADGTGGASGVNAGTGSSSPASNADKESSSPGDGI